MFDVDGQEVDSCFKKANLSVTGFSTIIPETKIQIYTQAEALGRELDFHMIQSAASTNDGHAAATLIQQRKKLVLHSLLSPQDVLELELPSGMLKLILVVWTLPLWTTKLLK